MVDVIKKLRKEYQETHSKFGQKPLTDFKQRVNWLKFHLPFLLQDNKNAILLSYWAIFDEAETRDKILNATPCETVLRNLRN